jgi:hypothetical protein
MNKLQCLMVNKSFVLNIILNVLLGGLDLIFINRPTEPKPTIILLHSSEWVEYGTQNPVKYDSQTTGPT